MCFNGKINRDGTIKFDRMDWKCTDPDNYQYCRMVNDTTFEYIQLRNEAFKNECDSLDPQMILPHLSDKTKPSDWYQSETDVTDYTEEEINEYLSAYGGILDGTTDEVSRNQLIAEVIFEQEDVANDWYE